ncbi:hypothetical protein M407DRAFT_24100 [Tulasnella calospora MUT 4182]|uniref:F-box domain-containing protein n=1 Tax=Tulasnella calospora MUT 4182 TaxID=1051891 RepID=A0A0C3Q9G6_9AGAM|nr:hypothetical protein M407DRAFT_24100 [Tulasnella calospora MUT 4182]
MAKEVLPPLPWEVLAHILTFVPPSRLRSVILTCQGLRQLAEPLLYRHISLSNSPTRCFYLLRTLLARDELCKTIQTFHPADRYLPDQNLFPLLGRIIGSNLGSAHQKAYHKHIERVQERLSRVENISIARVGIHRESLKTLDIATRFPQVKRLRTFSDDGELGSLLDALPHITHLELPFHKFNSAEDQVHPHHARYLEGLFCPPFVAVSLVPSRPIKHLALLWCSSSRRIHGLNNWEFMEVMGRSTGTIRSLALFFGSRANMPEEMDQIFSATARFLPDVEELTIWFVFYEHNPDGPTRTLSEFRESLSSFCKLRSVDFNGSRGKPSGVPYFDRRRDAISTVYIQILQIWSERCPTLERVTFPNGAVWIKEPILQFSKHQRQLLSFLRRTFFSVPRLAINPLSQEAKSSPEQEYSFGKSSASDDVAAQGIDISTNISDANINTSTRPSWLGPGHDDPNSNTSTTASNFKWLCLNQSRLHSNLPPPWFHFRIQKSEFCWGTPMFERDLNAGWPEGLPIETS